MEHLIERCAVANRDATISPSGDSAESTTTTESSTNSTKPRLTIEDQKNQVLAALSSGQSSVIVDLQIDLEVLIEILYDLLYALPHALIPRRMADVCSYASELDYEQAEWILEYLPRSHVTLFQLIAKFLGVYIRCYLGETTLVECSLSRSLAEACFQLDKDNGLVSSVTRRSSPPRASDKSKSDEKKTSLDCKSQNALHFLNLFVSNYGF